MRGILFIIFILVQLSVAAKEVVRVGVAHFPPFVDKEAKDLGVFPKYLKTFFDKEGIPVEFLVLPFARTQSYIESKTRLDYSIFSAPSLPAIREKTEILVTKPIYTVTMCLYYNKEVLKKGVNYKGIKSLKDKKVVVIVKAPITNALRQNNVPYYGVNAIPGALKMLEKKRANVFIMSRLIGSHYLKEMKLEHKIKCDEYISQQPVFLITSRVKKYKELTKKLSAYFLKNPLNDQL